ncbi:MAG: hypothetical protein LBQ15_04210 [Clostridium sp.]|jgi:RNA polymerase sigma-70 factor (ECF subfamily)|nr:hypothetical protein [Clostridium sp.]
MRDLRHRTADGYVEGDTEDLMMDQEESLEEQIISKMDLEILQVAMQSLTDIQKERLHFHFFEGLSTREIAEKQGTAQNAVWKSLQASMKKIKSFFE